MKDKDFKQYFLENLPDNVYGVAIELSNRFLNKYLQKALLYEEYIFAFDIFREFLDEHNVSYSIPKSLKNSGRFNYQTTEGIGDFFKKVKHNIQSLELNEQLQFRKKTISALWQENYSSKTTELPYYSVYIQTYQNEGDTFMTNDPKKLTKNDFRGASITGGFINAEVSYARDIGKTIHNYPAEQKQNLADAAAEIQQLLQQLEQNYPNATEFEKQSAIAVTLQQEIKQNPTFKDRLINAFREGGIEALKVLFGPIGIPIEMVKGWIEAEAS